MQRSLDRGFHRGGQREPVSGGNCLLYTVLCIVWKIEPDKVLIWGGEKALF